MLAYTAPLSREIVETPSPTWTVLAEALIRRRAGRKVSAGLMAEAGRSMSAGGLPGALLQVLARRGKALGVFRRACGLLLCYSGALRIAG